MVYKTAGQTGLTTVTLRGWQEGEEKGEGASQGLFLLIGSSC